MPRTALAIQNSKANDGTASLTQNNADQANGNSFLNDGNTVLVVKNGDASTRTITVNGVGCSHGRTANVAKAVVAGDLAILGPFDKDQFNQTDGTVQIDWSASTPTTVKCSPVALTR